jgi:hypothetical protein
MPKIKATIVAPVGATTDNPFDIFFTCDDRHDNLFIELDNQADIGQDFWVQVRYGNLDADHGTFVAPAGRYIARLREPKYASGANIWPVLAETVPFVVE